MVRFNEKMPEGQKALIQELGTESLFKEYIRAFRESRIRKPESIIIGAN
jgi:hypothetical protein